MILAGKPGCGKTHLARVVELHWWLRTALISEPDMLSRIQETYRGNGSESAVITQLRASPMLILDDVGAGHVTPESRTWLEGIYWRLIDRRAEHKLPLMMTTNLPLKELGAWIGQRALDRLIGLCGTRDGYVDMFDVPSHRRGAW